MKRETMDDKPPPTTNQVFLKDARFVIDNKNWHGSREALTACEHCFANPEIINLLLALNEAHPQTITLAENTYKVAEAALPEFAGLIFIIHRGRGKSNCTITDEGIAELKKRGFIGANLTSIPTAQRGV